MIPQPFTATCRLLPPLGRYYQRGQKLRVQYSTRIGGAMVPRRVRVIQGELTVMKFNLHPVIDIGLTMRIQTALIMEMPV